MKVKYIYIGLLAFLLVSVPACKDSFLDTVPQAKLTTGSYFSSDDEFIGGINGVYNCVTTYKKNEPFWPLIESATPCAVSTGGNRIAQYIYGKRGYTPTDFWAGYMWNDNWKGVRRASQIIEMIEKNGNVISSEALHNRIEGEAHFLRAYFYFYLTYLFGDVPYITSSTADVYPAKAPKSQIVELMVSDLKMAEDLLPSVKTYRGTADIGRASKGSAIALLGKVYCYEKQWAEAETELKKLAPGGQYGNDYKLNDSYIDQFTKQAGENSDESIFEMQLKENIDENRGSSYSTFAGQTTYLTGSAYNKDGFGYNQPTEYLADMFETKNGYDVKSAWVSFSNNKQNYTYASDDPAFDNTNDSTAFLNRDPRLMWTIGYQGSPYLKQVFPANNFRAADPTVTNYGPVKYVIGQAATEQSGQNEIIIRYADVLLFLAEAVMEQNRSSEAAPYVNMVRSRASVMMPDVPSSVYSDQAKMRAYIHRERIRELSMEFGHVYMDMQRWGTWITEMNNWWTPGKYGNTAAYQATFTNTQELFPIPQSEIDINKNLKQNPGY